MVTGVFVSEAAVTIWRSSAVVDGANALSAFPRSPEASSRYSATGMEAEVTVYLYDKDPAAGTIPDNPAVLFLVGVGWCFNLSLMQSRPISSL